MSNQEEISSTDNDTSVLTSLLCNHIVDGAKHLENRAWTNRSLTFVKAFVPVVVFLRDAQVADLLPTTLQHYLPLEKLVDIAFNHQGKYGEDFEAVCKPLANYIKALPSFNEETPLNLTQKMLDHHGLISMTMARIIGEMVVFGTSTMKENFIGKDLIVLMLAYNESLVKQANLDNQVFLLETDQFDSVFGSSVGLDDENKVFSPIEDGGLFASANDESTAEIIKFFAKSQNADDHIFDVKINKAS